MILFSFYLRNFTAEIVLLKVNIFLISIAV